MPELEACRGTAAAPRGAGNSPCRRCSQSTTPLYPGPPPGARGEPETRKRASAPEHRNEVCFSPSPCSFGGDPRRRGGGSGRRGSRREEAGDRRQPPRGPARRLPAGWWPGRPCRAAAGRRLHRRFALRGGRGRTRRRQAPATAARPRSAGQPPPRLRAPPPPYPVPLPVPVRPPRAAGGRGPPARPPGAATAAWPRRGAGRLYDASVYVTACAGSGGRSRQWRRARRGRGERGAGTGRRLSCVPPGGTGVRGGAEAPVRRGRAGGGGRPSRGNCRGDLRPQARLGLRPPKGGFAVPLLCLRGRWQAGRSAPAAEALRGGAERCWSAAGEQREVLRHSGAHRGLLRAKRDGRQGTGIPSLSFPTWQAKKRVWKPVKPLVQRL